MDATGRKDESILFREVQRFRQPWIWTIILAVSFLTIYVLVREIVQSSGGINSGSDAAILGIAVILGFGLPLLFSRLKFTTEIRPSGLYFRFFPMHFAFRKISFGDLAEYGVREYSAVREYGGWGIRYGSKGKAYNVSGNCGVQLVLSNGSRILIGSRRPDELVQALDEAQRMRR